MNSYLNLINRYNVLPNFWCTEEYLSIIQPKEIDVDGFIWLEDNDWILFPPLHKYNSSMSFITDDVKIWADFINFPILTYNNHTTFLDYEYWFLSSDFNNMIGRKWMVFRKNSKKWLKCNRGILYNNILGNSYRKDIEQLLISWLETKEFIHDEDVMLHYIFNGENRTGLWAGNKLIGLNCWDCFDKYYVYRYCLTDPNESFLNEYLRLLFYQNLPKHTWVNDGGVLDNIGIEKFKDKMNPRIKRKVHSYIGSHCVN